MKKYFIVLVFTYIFQCLNGQNFRFSHLDVSNGLSNGSVNCITQDSTGFIWIGTNDGLNRYDGYKFKVFLHKPSDSLSIITNTVNDILPEGDNLWVCTNKGIDYYDADKEMFINMPIIGVQGTKNLSILKAYKDFKKRLIIATHKGLFKLDSENKVFKKFYFNNKTLASLDNLEFTWITQDRDGVFWIGTLDYGIFMYNEKTNECLPIRYEKNGRNALLNNKVFCLYEDNQHTVWIGTNEGLFSYNKNNKSIKCYLPEAGRKDWLPHISVNRIIEDSRNNLWLATNGGLSRFNRNNETFTNYLHDDFDETTISNNSVHAIFEDAQKNIWIGSGERGLDIYKAQTIEFETFKKRPNNQQSLNYGYVVSVIEDSYGNIWVGTNGWGINKYNRKTGKFDYIRPPTGTEVGLQTGAILALFEDNEGKIWISTYLGGITVYNPKNNSYKTYAFDPENKNGITSNIINNFFQDKNGNIWIATNGGGVNIYDPKKNIFKHLNASKNGLSSDYCILVREDSKGYMWIGTFFGLNQYDPRTNKIKVFLNSTQKGSISSDAINYIYEDSKKRLWFGTEFGLDLYDTLKNEFTVFTDEDGLPNNVINGILEDNRGFLWISTNKGLSRFDPDNKFFTNYDVSDGIASLTFFRTTCFKSKSGWMYFGGSEGVTYFNPDKIKHTNYKAPLVLTEFYVHNQSIKPYQSNVLKKNINKTNEIILNHDQSFIAIEFASLNYINSNKDNFSYFLEGIDRQWNRIGNQHVAYYTNLPPGNYKFFVKSVAENGFESTRELKIKVKPAIWETKIAYSFYFLIIASLIYFIYSYFHSRTIFEHKQQIERLEKQKEIELYQTKLKFFINVSHEFKTPLTLIIAPLEKLISKGVQLTHDESNYLYHLIYRNTLRLSRLINQIMDMRRIDTGDVRLYVTENNIVELTKEIFLSFEEHARNHSISFKFNSYSDEIKIWCDVDKIEKIIYNLLSNAFRYTPDGQEITINIDMQKDETLDQKIKEKYPKGFVSISVEDKGKGISTEHQQKIFSRFYQIPSDSIANPASTGIGLSIAKEFIEMHNGEIKVESKIGEGSKFTLYIPLGKDHFKPEDIVTSQEETIYDNIKLPKISVDFSSSENEDDKAEIGSVGTKKNKILIVEDNYELRKYLYENLNDKYMVYEAANGKEALEIVKENYPDIVVSDVMMPIMNGYELCRAIKNDMKYSHIPIILLTVLNTINSQIEGLGIGADDYITKPFNLTILKARIFNLVENRKKLVRRFIEEIKPDTSKIVTNTLDEKFLQKAIGIVEKNISNTEFSAEDFASEIGMSRSNLHIKLKALTNQSATEFIRIIRLKKAIELLSTQQYNISEVSYMVGFNSISYFNRCFKFQFGVTPSEYVESCKNKT